MSKKTEASQEEVAPQVAQVVDRGFGEEVPSVVDISTLNTNEFHYRFIQERPQNIARKRSMGYVPVLAEEEGVETLTGEVAADGLIRDGDAILMRVPKERFLERRKRSKQLADMRLATADQGFKKKAKGRAPGGADVQVGEFNHRFDEDQPE